MLLGGALAAGSIRAEAPASAPAETPAHFRVAIVGLVHGHVRGVPARLKNRPDFELVGVAEADTALAKAFAEKNGLAASLFYTDLDEMLRKTAPDAVMVFTNTYDHRAVIEACARHKLPVMVEKPLATTYADALAIQAAAKQAGIPVLVNYETTWYPANLTAYELVHQNAIGAPTKILINDGHGGPQEGGVGPEFLRWLRDPKFNGGGAMFDFGCYGVDLATWLLDGRRPRSVTAIAQHFKPDVYPLVDDECTLVLAYDKTQAILQASWNWPVARKDMEVYGPLGYLRVPLPGELHLRTVAEKAEKAVTPAPLPAAQKDALAHFRAVVLAGEKPNGLSSLETNMVVMEVLDAARRSAATGRTIELPANP